MNKLQDAIKSGKKQQSQPAMVIANMEPPDIPEMVIGKIVASTLTGEDAVQYLARLSLGSWRAWGREGSGSGGGEEVRKGRRREME